MLLFVAWACSAPALPQQHLCPPCPSPACPQLLATQGHGAATQPEGPLVLILLPTRELAQQVAGVCRDLRKHSGLRTVCITGGTDKQQQVEALSKQVRINHTHTEPQLGTTIRSSSSCFGFCTGFCTACTVLLVPATHCAAPAPCACLCHPRTPHSLIHSRTSWSSSSPSPTRTALQPHIVVATPGRLLDLVKDNSLQLGAPCPAMPPPLPLPLLVLEPTALFFPLWHPAAPLSTLCTAS